MAIKFTKYIDITSAVGGQAIVNQRQLIGRMFTTNDLLPTGTIVEFSTASEVGSYFGTDSEEYTRAAFYFGWISKNITSPQNLSFARWADVDTNALIFGSKVTEIVADFAAITDGTLTLEIAGTTNIMTGIDFTGATSYADVAGVIEDAIQAETGTQWTAATVTFDSGRGGFNFVSGATGAATISTSATGSGTDLRNLIGWGALAIFSDGATAQTITEVLDQSTAVSDNFGTFLFMPSFDLTQTIEAATWNENYDPNVSFEYTVPVTLDDYSDYQAALADFEGTSLTVSVTDGEYPEQVSMMIKAATNYNARNSVQNYMFQQFNLTPSVADTSLSDTLDAVNVNYYGVTQTAGQLLAFYQRGVMMGNLQDPTDMNTYANEQWLKAAMAAAIMNLLMILPKISANPQGINQLSAASQTVIDQALTNGTISVGKTLSAQQKLFISNVTNDPNAWQQVQTSGYWVQWQIVLVDSDYQGQYVLVYSKDDIIRKVVGTDILI